MDIHIQKPSGLHTCESCHICTKILYLPFTLYSFCAVLDATKTGITVEPAQLSKDQQAYQRPMPAWKEPIQTDEKKSKFTDTSNLARLKRRDNLPGFIMDTLKAKVKNEYHHQMAIITQRLGPIANLPDEDLTEPWQTFCKRADAAMADGWMRLKEVADAIYVHVKAIADRWQTERHQAREAKQKAFLSKGKGRQTLQHGEKSPDVTFTTMPIELRQDILRNLSQSFAKHPDDLNRFCDDTELARIKASCAYSVACMQPSFERFPFDIATRDLCSIKAHAVSGGTEKTVTPDFYNRFDLHKGFFDS